MKYVGTNTQYNDGTSTTVETILNVNDVFSIQATRRRQKDNIKRDRKDNDIEYDIVEDGYITIYKNDKTYHQFSFKSHKNIDEFMAQYTQILTRSDDYDIVEIVINHTSGPTKHVVADSILA